MAISEEPPRNGPVPGIGRLLERLDRDPARAGSEFERLRRVLTKFFDWRGALFPEECADETLDRLARKLEEGIEVLDVGALAHGIARLVLLEKLRSQSRQVALDPLTGGWPSPEPQAEDPLLESLEQCLDALPGGGRELVLSYYAEPGGSRKIEARRRLARKLRLTDNALRSRVQRLRDRLEECVRRRSGVGGGETPTPPAARFGANRH